MRGNYRRKNRPQAQKEVRFEQDRFEGGYVSDIPGSDLPKDTMALLENFNAYPEYLEGRSGTKLYSSTALPGSGTVHSIAQNTVSGQWLLHRGTQLWIGTVNMSSWTEAKSLASISPAAGSIGVVAGDTSGQLAVFVLRNVNASNSNSGVNYWTLTNSGSTRTITVYKDSAHTQSVAQGSHLNNGQIFLTPLNSSALWGGVYVTYVTDDTDVGNTITIAAESSYGVNVASTIKAFDSDFIVAVGNSPLNYGNRCAIVKMAAGYFYNLNHVSNVNGSPLGIGFGPYPLVGTGTQSASTPYGYRFIYTYCRILDSSGNPSYSSTRVTGNLEKESAANFGRTLAGTDTQADYGEYWTANPLSVTNPLTINPTATGDLSAGVSGNNQLHAEDADIHWTHLGIYRTLDIGVSGTDPITGSGNNREIYTWCGDFPIYSTSLSITKADDEVRSLYVAGFALRTRAWQDMPTGEILEINAGFMYQATRSDNKVYYCQLANKAYAGYYQPAYQYMRLNDGVQIIAKSPDMMSFICSNSTYISSPTSYLDVGEPATGSIYVLQHLTKASASIGCADYGSFAEVDSANQLGTFGQGGSTAYIARCSDNTIRIWNNSNWSSDLSSRRVNKTVQTMLAGSVGAYWKGIYKLYYRTSSGSSNNTACLRFGMSTDAGFGWSQETGSALPLPQTYVGAGSFIDANGVQRMYCLDASDGLFYWIETFTSYSGSSLTKVFLDKVAVNGTGGTAFTCKARFREITGPSEGFALLHKEASIYDRPYDEATGFISGFSRNYLVYIDGSSTAAGTITGAAKSSDLQFFETISGFRIQPEVQFTRSGARLTGFEALFDAQDKATIGVGPSATTEAANQAALAQNMKIWLTRPSNLLDRASGSSFTLTGTAPTNVTSPDGKTYGLSFVSGASYSLAETTSYTDFALHFWVKSAATASRIVQITGANSFYVSFVSSTSLSVNGAGNLTVSTIAAGWHDFWIVRSGSTVTVYQNGAAVAGTVSVSTARGGTTFNVNPDAAVMSLFDIRAYNTTVSASDVAYYYASVTTTNGGTKVLPLG